MNGKEIKPIKSIDFTLWTYEEIKSSAVVEVCETNLKGSGGIYDLKMGPRDDKLCETCGGNKEFCPGHFGWINIPSIIHPLKEMLKRVQKYLQLFCKSCHRLRMTKITITSKKLGRYKGDNRMKAILNELKTNEKCPYCNTEQSGYTIKQGKIYETTKDKEHEYEMEAEDVEDIFKGIQMKDLEYLGFSNDYRIHPINLILRALPVLPPVCRPIIVLPNGTECHDDLSHKYLDIVKVVKKLEDKKLTELSKKDLVSTLEFHIKTLFDNKDGKSKITNNNKPIKAIKQRLTGKKELFRNNLSGKRCDFNARTVVTGDTLNDIDCIGIPISVASHCTFPERVNNLNINELQSYIDSIQDRTKDITITRDDSLFHLTHIGKIWEGTFTLNEFHRIVRGKEYLTMHSYWCHKGKKLDLREDDIVLDTDGRQIKNIFNKRKRFLLQNGDIVDRPLKNGDVVLVNRQPTLWKPSMMAHKVKILPYSTFRIHQNICTPYNADFDGDEMNIHIPQSYGTVQELKDLSSVEANILSTQNGRTIIGICQDDVTGGNLLTDGVIKLEEWEFNDLTLCITSGDINIFERMDEIKEILDEHKISLYSGYGIISMILPNRLEFSNYNKGRIGKEGEPVIITRGVMISGALNSNVICKSANSIISILIRTYSRKVALDFSSNYSRIISSYLLQRGFSVGLADCFPPNVYSNKLDVKTYKIEYENKTINSNVNNVLKKVGRSLFGMRQMEKQKNEMKLNPIKEEVKSSIIKSYIEADTIMKEEKNIEYREQKILNALNNAHDIGSRITNNCLNKRNNYVRMIETGAKGKNVNITQILGLVGQQNIEGERVRKDFGGRSLPHFKRTSYNSKAPDILWNRLKGYQKMKEMEKLFESRGFVSHSYIDGLSPAEFFFHGKSGRVGVAEHAAKVPASGYGERKMVKTMEDLKVTYTGTIENSQGNIVSFALGDDNMAGEYVSATEEGLSFINLKWWVDRLNKDIESNTI